MLPPEDQAEVPGDQARESVRPLAYRLAVVAVLLGLSVTVSGQLTADVAVKAAFIARFPEFIEWPTLPGLVPQAPAVCLSPAHPFGTEVARLATDTTIRGRRVVVRHLDRGEAATGCAVLYVAPPDRHLLDESRNRPVLTVGDEPDFCQRGGIINLRVIGGRVRFEIDLPHARAAGLAVDSQLLRLAAVVHGGLP